MKGWLLAPGLAVALLGAIACGGSEEAASVASPLAQAAPTIAPSASPTPECSEPDPILCWHSVLRNVAETPQEAAGFAREELGFAPPLSVHELSSLQYVEITAKEGRDLLDPSGTTVWEVRDEAAALLFLARGRFSMSNRFSQTPPPVFYAYCIVVPIGERGTFSAGCADDIALSQFGEVQEVPLPLPPFPTPVELGAEARRASGWYHPLRL